MAGTTIEGVDGKVTLGSNTVLGIGTWKYTPGGSAELDNTEFGDTTEQILLGMRKRGSISFNGLAKLGDTTGQEACKLAQINATNITSLRFYCTASSYYTPNATTGYFSPSSTTANATQSSYVNITAFDIGSDKNGLATISFTGTVSGDMVLV